LSVRTAGKRKIHYSRSYHSRANELSCGIQLPTFLFIGQVINSFFSSSPKNKLFFPASNISQLGVTDGCATGVYGQPDLTTVSDCSAYVTSTSLGAIYGVEVASDGTLFVADYYHRRVVIYPADVPPSPFGVAAIDVLGQPNLESSGSGTQLDQLGGAYFMEWDDPYKCLWVCDYPNNRVLRYSNILSPVVQNTTGNGPSLSFPTRAPNAVLSPEGLPKVSSLNSPEHNFYVDCQVAKGASLRFHLEA